MGGEMHHGESRDATPQKVLRSWIYLYVLCAIVAIVIGWPVAKNAPLWLATLSLIVTVLWLVSFLHLSITKTHRAAWFLVVCFFSFIAPSLMLVAIGSAATNVLIAGFTVGLIGAISAIALMRRKRS